MKYKKPEASQLVEMIEMILGVDAKASPTAATTTDSVSHVALYVNRDGEKVATCSCAMPTAAALACALSMIPPGGAEGMVEDKALTENATGNYYEVMNIFSSLLMSDKSEHLKLTTVETDASQRMVGDGVEEESFALTLGAYGEGELIFNYI